MAEQADGSVIIGTELNSEGFKAGSAELQRAVKSLIRKVNDLGPTFYKALSGSESAITSFDAKTAALEDTIAEIETKMEALGNATFETADYEKLCAEIDAVYQKLDQLTAKRDKLHQLDIDVNEESKSYKSLIYDITELESKYLKLIALKEQMASSGTAYQVGSETAGYQRMNDALDEAKSKLTALQTEARKSKYSLKSMSTGLASGLKSAVKSMAKLVTGTKSANKQFSSLISSVKRFTLSLLGARGAYTILHKAVSAYMAENEQLTANLNACWTSLGNLLGPIINRVITLISTAIAYLTEFLKLLGFTGKSTSKAISSAGKTAEKETKKLERHLASFDELERLGSDNTSDNSNTADPGTSDITGIVPNVTIPDWIKKIIELLKSGNWSEAATVLTDKLNEMVESVDWEGLGSKIGYYLNGALEFLATAITTFDWYNLGVSLGEMLNNIIYAVDWSNLGIVLGGYIIALIEGLGGLFATINWRALGKALGDAFMGLWNAIDWKQAAKTLSDGLIGVLNGLSSAIATVDWEKLGRDIGTFLRNIDWFGIFASLGELLWEAFKAALELLAGFITGLGPEMIFSAILVAISAVAAKIAAKTLIAPLIKSLLDVFKFALGKVITYIVATIGGWPALIIAAAAAALALIVLWLKDGGIDVIKGFLQGIKEGIQNIGTWLKENIFVPFVEGFKALFGIHSPSTVMQELGGYIIEGLLLGLQNGWTALVEWLTAAFAELLAVVKEWAANAGEAISSWVSDIGMKIQSWASNAGANIRDWASGAISSFKSWAADTKSQVTKWASNVSSSISNWASVAAAKFKDWATNTSEKVSGWVETTKSKVSEWADNTKERIKNWSDITKSDLTSWVSSTKSSIVSWGADVYANIQSKIESVRTTIASGFTNARNTMVNNMQSAMNSIKGQNWYGIGYNICSGIANGLSNGWSWLTDLVYRIANSLYRSACSALGIHSPSTLFRDGVGLNIGYGIGKGIEASKGSVLDSVVGVADAIAAEFNANEYSVSEIGVDADGNITQGLNSFSDKIANSFTALMDRMQVIADSVSFTIPTVATSAIPYATREGYTMKMNNISGSAGDTQAIVNAITADLIPAMIAGLEAIIAEQQSTRQMIGEIEIGDSVIGEACRRYNRKMAVIHGGPIY